MTPTTNKITFKITYDEYLTYYQENFLHHQRVYKAFGKNWFIECIEIDKVDDIYPQCFVTFKLAS